MTPLDVDPRDVLARLLHELGSPIGAAANHLYLADAEGPAALARGSLARAQEVLARGRRWLEACELHHQPELLDPLPLAREAHAALDPDRMFLARLEVGRSQPVAATREVLRQVFRTILERQTSTKASPQTVRVDAVPQAKGCVRIVVGVGEHAEEPRPPGDLRPVLARQEAGMSRNSDLELLIVATLMARLGGEAFIAEDQRGSTLALCLPAAAHSIGPVRGVRA